ncbi:MAG: DNA cytosine methyltransferase [Thermoleophilia bacterium]
MAKNHYTAVSLYSGAGGMDQGFRDAGFRMQWAVDADRWAVESYRRNLGQHIMRGILPGVDLPAGIGPDLVFGGPPCQGFSVIGRMDPGDPRSAHVFCFMDIVERLGPRAFVLENVKALAVSSRWTHVRDGLRDWAQRLGYHSAFFVLNAAHYGVPQARERMFLVGIRGATPLLPTETTRGAPLTVGDVLRALPPVGHSGNDGMCRARVVPAKRPVMRPTAHAGSLLFNGSGRPLRLDAPAKTIPASMGGNATPIVDQRELDHGGESWVVGYHAYLLSGGRPLGSAPAFLRRITVQEAAALQTFPQQWQLSGPQVAQYRQIGNAVPPRLAYAVGLSVRQVLQCIDGCKPGEESPEPSPQMLVA